MHTDTHTDTHTQTHRVDEAVEERPSSTVTVGEHAVSGPAWSMLRSRSQRPSSQQRSPYELDVLTSLAVATTSLCMCISSQHEGLPEYTLFWFKFKNVNGEEP